MTLSSNAPTRRLLLVDDDPRNLKLLQARLGHLGHELVCAMDGQAAIDAFEATSPDLVLLDLVMPGLGGLEVLQHIRKSETGRHVPVILVTAHSEREHRLRGLQAGADEFLEKPIDGPILLARVKMLLALKESRDALQASRDSLDSRNQALEKLRREQRELTQFVVHDLKSPLTAICGNLEWVLTNLGGVSPEVVEALFDANAESIRLSAMIENLLIISQLEQSATNVEREQFQVTELLKAVVAAHVHRAELQGVSLEPPRPLPCKVWADRALVRRVFENILDNSLRYTPAGGRVQISAQAKDGVEVLFANDGPRIALKDQSRIFEKFARGHNERPMAGNAGLGLYFCKCAVEANGGHINLVESAEWSTCFRIQLPATS
jgi:two-component system, sensor histidine kinase and response regulator